MNEKFGRYTVLAEAGSKNDMRQVLCRCECGTERVVYMKNLRSGNSQSCGCLASETTARRNFKHGHAKTPTWQIWVGMLQRCSETATGDNKAAYFDRGIRVCERWQEFANFLADMGERPTGMSLDRHPNGEGNYEPGNCRWATPTQQSRNTSRNKLLTFAGETLTCAEWAQRKGWSPDVIKNRLRYGWPVERILTTEPHPNDPGLGVTA